MAISHSIDNALSDKQVDEIIEECWILNLLFGWWR